MDLAALPSTAQHLLMPAVAFAAVGVLALVLRWSQTPRRSGRRRSASPRGLLVPIASFPTQDAADELAGRLRRDGIRAALAPSVRGIDVLVWQEEYGEARLRITDGGSD
ncbi:MAG: hypothetical protein ACRDO7_15775 [Nocardioidaceae bacterium]